MDYKLMRNKRRAISSVVGLFFFIVVMVGAFTAFILMMETNTEFLNTQLDISQHELAKLQEDFIIFADAQTYRDPSGKPIPDVSFNQFNITVDVENKGKTPVEVVNLWIINKTLPSGAACETDSSEPCEANLVEINYADSFVPVRSTVNILENIPVTMQRGNYDLKVVTSLGNIEILPIRIGGPPMWMKLIANPPVVPNLSNMTLIMTVTNNSTKTLYDVKPNPLFPTVKPTTSIAPEIIDGVPVEDKVVLREEKIKDQLRPGETVSFIFEYQLTGAAGSAVSFTTNATAKKESDSPDWTLFSNNDTATITMADALGAGIANSLRQKPEIFVLFPGPFGISDTDESRGFFGAIIVNPTNQTAEISRVSMIMTTAVGGTTRIVSQNENDFDHILPCCLDTDVVYNGEKIRVEQGGSSINAYGAGSDGLDDPIGRWSIPEENVLVWTNIDGHPPVIVNPESAKAFAIRIEASSQLNLPAFIIGANTHSTMGQFANVGHTSSTFDSAPASSIINVYPSSRDLSGSGLSYNTELVENFYEDYDLQAVGSIDALEANRVLNVTIREGTTDTSNYMVGGGSNPGKLIMKLPPGFPEVDFNCCLLGTTDPFPQTGFDKNNIKARTFRDGAIQIEVPLTENLGDEQNTDSERFTFQFSVKGPDVRKDNIYIYYAFASGVDDSDNPVGPVSEAIVLKVIGKDSPCWGNRGAIIEHPIDELNSDLDGIDGPPTDGDLTDDFLCE